MKLLISTFIGALLLLGGIQTKAQDQPQPPAAVSAPTAPLDGQSILDSFKPLLSATNWTAVPYVTYAPDAPTKYGGGVLTVYNLNDYVGGGVGIDWLGHFSLVSGNLTIKYPIDINLFGKPITVTPFGIGGIATPFGGAGEDNGGIATIEGGGVTINKLFTIFKGDVGVGAAVINWTSAGDYSGKHYQGFVTWHSSF